MGPHDPLRIFPYAPFTEPLPVPGVSACGDSPLLVPISGEWLPYLLGALEVYRYDDAWQASGQTLIDTLQDVQALFHNLSRALDMSLWRVQNCSIEYSDDCGATWQVQTRFVENNFSQCLWRVDVQDNLSHPVGVSIQGNTGRAFFQDLVRASGPNFWTQMRDDAIQVGTLFHDIAEMKFDHFGVIPDTYRGRVRFFTSDYSGTYENLRIESREEPRIGFLGGGPRGIATVTGDIYGNSALSELLTYLAQFGLVIDQTTDSGVPAGEPGPPGPPGPPGQDGEDCDCNAPPDSVPDDGSGQQICGSAVYLATRVYDQLNETLNIIDAYNVDGLLGEAIDLLVDVIGRGVVRAGVSALSQFITGAASQVDTTQARAQLTIALQNDYICWMYCNSVPTDPDLHRSWWANDSGAGSDAKFIADGLFESITADTLARASAIGSGAPSTFCASFCEPCPPDIGTYDWCYEVDLTNQQGEIVPDGEGADGGGRFAAAYYPGQGFRSHDPAGLPELTGVIYIRPDVASATYTYVEVHLTATDESAESQIVFYDASGNVLDSVSFTNDADVLYWSGSVTADRMRIYDAVLYEDRPNTNRITYVKIAGTDTNPFTTSNC